MDEVDVDEETEEIVDAADAWTAGIEDEVIGIVDGVNVENVVGGGIDVVD